MPALTVAGVTVPVAPTGFREEAPFEVGEVLTAVDGSLLDSRQSRKRRWKITTAPMQSATAATVRAALEGATPLTCAGDALGSTINCAARITGSTAVKAGGGICRVLEFELLQV